MNAGSPAPAMPLRWGRQNVSVSTTSPAPPPIGQGLDCVPGAPLPGGPPGGPGVTGAPGSTGLLTVAESEPELQRISAGVVLKAKLIVPGICVVTPALVTFWINTSPGPLCAEGAPGQ